MGVSTCVRMMIVAAILAITSHISHAEGLINQEIDLNPTEIMYTSSNPSVNHTRHAQHAVLAYLTPWNQGGFTSALKSIDRFTHLSPVWHQMKVTPKGNGSTLTVDGLNDPHWIGKLRSLESETKLVPRIVIEMNKEHQVKLAKSKKMQSVFIKRLLNLIEREEYDGIVLEATDFHALAREDSMKALISSLRFTVEIGQQLHRMNPPREFILVVRPWFFNTPYFQHEDAVPVGEAIDYYSLMTYDYSTSSTKPGPNAPLPWCREVVQKFIGTHSTERSRSKVLMGLNFYGMLWGQIGPQRPVVGHEFETLLSSANNVEKTWQNDSFETLTVIDNSVSVFYPDSRSISARVDAANEWGVGLSIWELGQGTPELIEQL